MDKAQKFILAKDPDYTVSDYDDDIRLSNLDSSESISNALKRRLLQRYIIPSESLENKNGFNIMANCCLVIETLESFHRGWSKTPNGGLAFCGFFNRVNHFKDFVGNDTPNQFYKHIRCGILHQGETTGGWRIRRKGSSIINISDKIINANLFRDALRKEIEEYFTNLSKIALDQKEWVSINKKMKSIKKNCVA